MEVLFDFQAISLHYLTTFELLDQVLSLILNSTFFVVLKFCWEFPFRTQYYGYHCRNIKLIISKFQ